MAKHRPGMVAPNDQILTKTAEVIPVNDITAESTQTIIENLLKLAYGEQTDRKKPILVGLAAPQAGISKRIILVDVGADGHGDVSDLRVFINPEITYFSDDKTEWYEGCFSTDRVCGIVERPNHIRLIAYDRNGSKIDNEYEGYVHIICKQS